MAMISVIDGKACKSSTPARNSRRKGIFRRDSAYPAVQETESTSSITELAKTKVLRVTCQMLAFPSMSS